MCHSFYTVKRWDVVVEHVTHLYTGTGVRHLEYSEREKNKTHFRYSEKEAQQDDSVTGAFLWEKWKFSDSRLCRNWKCNDSKDEYRSRWGCFIVNVCVFFLDFVALGLFHEIIMHNSLCDGWVSQAMTVCIRWFLSPDITDEPQVSSGQVTHLQPAGESYEAWRTDVCCPGTQVSCLFCTTSLFLPWTIRTNSLCFVYVFTWANRRLSVCQLHSFLFCGPVFMR